MNPTLGRIVFVNSAGTLTPGIITFVHSSVAGMSPGDNVEMIDVTLFPNHHGIDHENYLPFFQDEERGMKGTEGKCAFAFWPPRV